MFPGLLGTCPLGVKWDPSGRENGTSRTGAFPAKKDGITGRIQAHWFIDSNLFHSYMPYILCINISLLPSRCRRWEMSSNAFILIFRKPCEANVFAPILQLDSGTNLRVVAHVVSGGAQNLAKSSYFKDHVSQMWVAISKSHILYNLLSI